MLPLVLSLLLPQPAVPLSAVELQRSETTDAIQAALVTYEPSDFDHVMEAAPGFVELARHAPGSGSAVRSALVPAVPTTDIGLQRPGMSWGVVILVILLAGVAFIALLASVGAETAKGTAGGVLLLAATSGSLFLFRWRHSEVEPLAVSTIGFVGELVLLIAVPLSVILTAIALYVIFTERPRFAALRASMMLMVAASAVVVLVRAGDRYGARLIVDNATESTYSVSVAGYEIGVLGPRQHADVRICLGGIMHSRGREVLVIAKHTGTNLVDSTTLNLARNSSYIFNLQTANAYKAETVLYGR